MKSRMSNGWKQLAVSFSLIELLMCIAIVAVMTALLMPAVKIAKDRTKTVVCLNNLRQIGQGMLLYAADRGSFPYASHHEWWCDWGENIIPYIDPGKYVLLVGGDNGPAGIWQEVTTGAWVDRTYSQRRWKYFTCPAAPPATAPPGGILYPHNYGCNEWVIPVNYKDYSVGGRPIPAVRPARLLRPGTLIMICDSGIFDPALSWGQGDGSDTCYQFKIVTELAFIADPVGERANGNLPTVTPAANDNDNGTGIGYPVYYRHQGRCHAVMADGHVQGFANGEMKRRNWVPPEAIYKEWENTNNTTYITVGYP